MSKEQKNEKTDVVTESYQDYLIGSLKDPEEAIGYLQASFKEDGKEGYARALKNVIEAQQCDKDNERWFSFGREIEFGNRSDVEEKEKWRDIRGKIPFIRFKEHWKVRVIPPYLGAVARFEVKDGSSDSDARCSVYLDWFNVLGWSGGEPYWEVYTGVNEEGPERFDLDDTAGVVDCIDRQLTLANSE